ncbi:hypothetical protein TPR58_09310 [Sphingomonas sp. HF-S3]|uniref:DoxX family protein n=1 Tax=Sphingomonas rustica TaxID=3103142 RepID=A0ABV0B9F2_9SPHN
MPGIVANFPNGRVGAGLLMLRLSGAFSILITPELAAAAARPWVTTLLAIGLILGFWTRAVALLGIGVALVALLKGALPVTAGAQILEIAAILALGPGAYSSDCLMFGRRTVVLQRHD